MLQIKLQEREFYNEEFNEFIKTKPRVVNLEHSLISISKWESKWHRPFLNTDKTESEIRDYINCMVIGNPDEDISKYLSVDDIKRINDYIIDSMTATTFSEKQRGRKETITSELVYYMMTAYNIPFECEKWHISRLLTLIRICSEKNDTSKHGKKGKIPKNKVASKYREINAQRRAAMNSKG